MKNSDWNNYLKALLLIPCMLADLSEIRQRRKQLNLTQQQLAELSGVSQSLIAKIEGESAIPSYENAKKLFDCLERISEKHGVIAVHLMRAKVVTVLASESIQKAVRLMEKSGISQLPVLEGGKVVGTVSEKGLLARIGGLGSQKMAETLIRDAMEEALPQIQPNTPFKVLASILEHSPAALVVEKGKIKGIISKSDLLKSVLDRKITRHQRLI